MPGERIAKIPVTDVECVFIKVLNLVAKLKIMTIEPAIQEEVNGPP